MAKDDQEKNLANHDQIYWLYNKIQVDMKHHCNTLILKVRVCVKSEIPMRIIKVIGKEKY